MAVPWAGAKEKPDTVLAAGRSFLETNCTTCHEPVGTAGIASALEESEWAAAGKEPLIRILLQGIMADRGVMMPFGWMKDRDLAALVSYIRMEWHKGSLITPEEVARIRKETAGRSEYWTPEELKALGR